MKMIKISKNNWVILITRKQWKSTWYWLENNYFICGDVSMLGCGCGVSQYPQFCVKDLDMYQVLPRPYLSSFDGFTGDELIIKKGC